MKHYDKELSLTFVAIYLKNGKKLYRSSHLQKDAISKEEGMEGLRNRLILNKHLGQYSIAIIFDNNTKEILEKYNHYGILTYRKIEKHQTNDFSIIE